MSPQPRQSASVPVHKIRRCPKCGAVTDRVSHCFKKGRPMFPQTDTDTMTEPCEVVERAPFVEALALMRGDGSLDTTTYYRVLELITPWEGDEDG